jgi:hypothetical protein
MNPQTLPWSGGCRCGRVRIKVSAPPLLTMACHCSGCQKMSASAFSLTAAVPNQGFEVTQGETVIGGLHGDAQHNFCPHCMSWMFTRPAGMPFVNLRPTMLDDHLDFRPFIESYTSERLPWAATPAVHSFEKFPPMEAYGGLMKAYGEWAAAPAPQPLP